MNKWSHRFLFKAIASSFLALTLLAQCTPAEVRKWMDDLDSRDFNKRLTAIRRLGSLKEKAIGAAKRLIAIIHTKKSHPALVGEAALAIGRIGEKGDIPIKSAVKALTAVLTSKNRSVKKKVCLALGSLGAKAKSAIPQLVALLQSSAMVKATIDHLDRKSRSAPSPSTLTRPRSGSDKIKALTRITDRVNRKTRAFFKRVEDIKRGVTSHKELLNAVGWALRQLGPEGHKEMAKFARKVENERKKAYLILSKNELARDRWRSKLKARWRRLIKTKKKKIRKRR